MITRTFSTTIKVGDDPHSLVDLVSMGEAQSRAFKRAWKFFEGGLFELVGVHGSTSDLGGMDVTFHFQTLPDSDEGCGCI